MSVCAIMYIFVGCDIENRHTCCTKLIISWYNNLLYNNLCISIACSKLHCHCTNCIDRIQISCIGYKYHVSDTNIMYRIQIPCISHNVNVKSECIIHFRYGHQAPNPWTISCYFTQHTVGAYESVFMCIHMYINICVMVPSHHND